MSDWAKREPLGAVEELKFLRSIAGQISDHTLAEYVKQRMLALEEQLKQKDP